MLCLSPPVVIVILDVASNFAGQFSPQSWGRRPRTWLPLTKEVLAETPRTALPDNVKHGEEFGTFRGVFSIVYTPVSISGGEPV